jgi:hypothetical protein
MNASERPPLLPETDRVKEHRDNPRIDTVPQELCPNEQAAPWDPVGLGVPDQGLSEAFVGGAGI